MLAGNEPNSPHYHDGMLAGPALEFRFFDSAQAAAIEAVTDQIIPEDQQPGAKWAGVVHYIDLALIGDLKDFGSAYNRGIQRIEALAQISAFVTRNRQGSLECPAKSQGNAGSFRAPEGYAEYPGVVVDLGGRD